MAGGSGYTLADVAELIDPPPQWSPGLMAGGRRRYHRARRPGNIQPQWSPGLMAGGRQR